MVALRGPDIKFGRVVMTCPQCRGLDKLFDDKTATKELKAYRKKGPSKTIRILIDALKAEGVEKMTFKMLRLYCMRMA